MILGLCIGTSIRYFVVTILAVRERGWGVFARAGVADPATNPIANFLSAGFGGNSRVFGRDADTFSSGWFYAGTSNDLSPALATALGGVGNSQGGEIFSDLLLNSRLSITWDGQVVIPTGGIDYTLVTGFFGENLPLDFGQRCHAARREA
jgi:porin